MILETLARQATRRRVIVGALALGVGWLVPRGSAAAQAPTPGQTAGPYYPRHLEIARLDHDLTQAPGRAGPVTGEIIDLVGTVRGDDGRALPGAVLLIWQADAIGRYNHPADSRPGPRDPHFEGAGLTRADGDGRYRFRTVRPAPYPPGGTWQRTPHIHFAVEAAGAQPLITQMYFDGEPLNAEDGLFRRLGAEAARLIAAREEDARLRFDIVLRDA